MHEIIIIIITLNYMATDTLSYFMHNAKIINFGSKPMRINELIDGHN